MAVPFGMSNVNVNGLDLSADNGDGTAYVLTDVSGWDGSPATTLSLTQRVRANGAWAGDSYSAARHVGLTGYVHSYRADGLLDAMDALNAAFPTSPVQMTVTEQGVSRWVTAVREDELDISRKNRWYATFTTQMAVADWRKFSGTRSGVTHMASTTGGLTIPFTVPFSIDAVSISGAVTLENTGNVSGPLTLRIDGPVVGPRVSNQDGKVIGFSSALTLSDNQYLLIDTEARTVLLNGQAPRDAYMTSREWFGFEPGYNTFSFTASQYNADATLTVTGVEAER